MRTQIIDSGPPGEIFNLRLLQWAEAAAEDREAVGEETREEAMEETEEAIRAEASEEDTEVATNPMVAKLISSSKDGQGQTSRIQNNKMRCLSGSKAKHGAKFLERRWSNITFSSSRSQRRTRIILCCCTTVTGKG